MRLEERSQDREGPTPKIQPLEVQPFGVLVPLGPQEEGHEGICQPAQESTMPLVSGAGLVHAVPRSLYVDGQMVPRVHRQEPTCGALPVAPPMKRLRAFDNRLRTTERTRG